MKRITEAWLVAANDDLKVVKKIKDDELLTHIAAFHCQQAAEKMFKAIIEEFELKFIKTHNLENLYEQVKDIVNLDIDYEIIEKLDSLYIDSRYPSSFGLLPNGKPGSEEISMFVQFINSIKIQIIDFLDKR